jgi:hypothetical protein
MIRVAVFVLETRASTVSEPRVTWSMQECGHLDLEAQVLSVCHTCQPSFSRRNQSADAIPVSNADNSKNQSRDQDLDECSNWRWARKKLVARATPSPASYTRVSAFVATRQRDIAFTVSRNRDLAYGDWPASFMSRGVEALVSQKPFAGVQAPSFARSTE